MGPLAGVIGGMAAGAATKGLGKLISGRDEEEAAREAALLQLQNRYTAGSGYQQQAPIKEEKEGSDTFKDLVLPLGQSVIGSLGEDKKKNDSLGKQFSRGFSRG